VRRTLDLNKTELEYLESEFRRLGIPFVPTNANFVLADLDDSAAAFKELLRRGVIVRPMAGYGFPRHVRISVGLPDENRRLITALEAMRRRETGS
jgi:histidinol-phosphate aminotransferase